MIVLCIIAFAGFLSTLYLFHKGPYAIKEDPATPPEAPRLPQEPVPDPEPVSMPTKPEILYQTALDCLGTHQTLNPAIPKDVGCAEALSAVAKNAGVPGIPALGYAGTANLYLWLKANPDFVKVLNPIPGDIIISPTGYGNGQITGHTGVVGKFHIMSNNSDTGLFSDHWTLSKWENYYHGVGALPVCFFRWVG